jgi:hypothetical protein
MTPSSTAKAGTSEVAIFGRLLTGAQGEMAADLARYILTLGFSDTDQARMQDLAARNQEGTLSSEETEELMAFIRAGHWLALLHSKARQALKKHKGS